MTHTAKHGLSRLPCLVGRQFENYSCITILLCTIPGSQISISSLIGVCIVAEKEAKRPVKRVKSLDRKVRVLRNMKHNENYLDYFVACIINLN